MVMLRRTGSQGIRRASWKTIARRRGTRNIPSTSASSALRSRRNVLFPEPLRPRSATSSPASICRLRSFRTCRALNCLPTCAAMTASPRLAGVVAASSAIECPPPGQEPSFEKADRGERKQAENCINGEQDKDHVDAEIFTRIVHHPAEPLRRIDRLREDQREPR